MGRDDGLVQDLPRSYLSEILVYCVRRAACAVRYDLLVLSGLIVAVAYRLSGPIVRVGPNEVCTCASMSIWL